MCLKRGDERKIELDERDGTTRLDGDEEERGRWERVFNDGDKGSGVEGTE